MTCITIVYRTLSIILNKLQVGQAKSDSEESTAQVEKALSEVKAIVDELHSLRDINLDDLDALGKYCCAMK